MGVHSTFAGKPQSSVIVVIRHAEKPDTGDGLAPAGEARANAYVDFLGTSLWIQMQFTLTTYSQQRIPTKASVLS